MRWITNGAVAVVVLVAPLVMIVPAAGSAHPPSALREGTDPRPNIVVVVTDDQPQGMLDAMPYVQSQIFDRGVTLDTGIIPTSQCCPSRAGLLSGRYAHTTDVYFNSGPHGGWRAFRPWESRALPVKLNDSGYRTMLVGKYLNGWGGGGRLVPPGWDVFTAMVPPSYYDYQLDGTEGRETYGSEPSAYSTDVLARRAADYIKESPADAPLFMYFAPFGPHGPFTPADRHEDTWGIDPLGSAFNEADMSDKPRFMRTLPLQDPDRIQANIRDQHETLRSVDEAVEGLVDALGPARAANTLFVFTADNGLAHGAHRLRLKYNPYRGASQVDMALRWDDVLPVGQHLRRVFTVQDLTATIAAAAGVWMGRIEGVGYFDGARSGTVIEALAWDKGNGSDFHPAYCGFRTRRYLFVEYSEDQGRELYDLRTDPHELQNVARDGAYSSVVHAMRARAQEQCAPVPPGFVW